MLAKVKKMIQNTKFCSNIFLISIEIFYNEY